MAELNLDDLMVKKAKTVENVAIETPTEPAATALTDEDKFKAAKIASSLDVTDTAAMLGFGAPAQEKIAQFSTSVLENVRTKDSGEVGELLKNLVATVKGYEPQEGSMLSKIPFIGSLINSANNLKKGYDKLSSEVNAIEGALEQARLKLMKDVALYDKLYAENLAYFKNLNIYIYAGEQKLDELKRETLPRLREQAAARNDEMAVQVVADFENSVARFEKKLHDLKLSKTIAIQTAPQLRLLQNNDKALIDRVQTAINSTIPLWKNQLVIALGLAAQNRAIKIERAVTDATNDLLKKNAAMLEQNSIAVAKENERGIVDIETVREVNERLIHTIEETLNIQKEGRQQRAAAEQELSAIEGKLKETLLKHS